MVQSARPGVLQLLRLRMVCALLLLVVSCLPAASDLHGPTPFTGKVDLLKAKAMVHLEPPWSNVLKEDDVTLSCQGAHSSGNLSTKWFHNGNLIPTQGQPSYSFKATITDSGLYACQTDQTSLSDAVHLNVTADWVLLQTLRQVIQDGEPLLLRCHSWKQRPLFKINFYRDSKAIWYSPRNSSFFIPQANVSHSGKYHCSGFQGQMRHESHPVSITVQGVEVPSILSVSWLSLPWFQIAFVLVIGLLFAVDTGLYFSVRKELQSSMGTLRNYKVAWSKSPEDSPPAV